ncbi:hypothetical protein EYF80_049650 [Liparis tanakae]|uniref:Uncharacterized protein n=1 Tax=Liparis tanakae TaxID=230148 RepID=A0A4Z2FG61_9TELE|nr:hypothetical protein EYF80_049650 [Liparis tanakae]
MRVQVEGAEGQRRCCTYMQVASRAGMFLRGAEAGTSRALSCRRPSMANAALPHASTKLERTSRRELSRQAAAKGSRASSSVRIAAQNWKRERRRRRDETIAITGGKCVSEKRNIRERLH